MVVRNFSILFLFVYGLDSCWFVVVLVFFFLFGVVGLEELGRDGICILILSKKLEDEFKMEIRLKLNLLYVCDGDWIGDRKEIEVKM